MDSLLSVALSNALAATLLALVAVIAGRLVRRPALTHGLWLLVLLKLFTPPLFRVPVSWPTGVAPATSEEPATDSPPVASATEKIEIVVTLPSLERTAVAKPAAQADETPASAVLPRAEDATRAQPRAESVWPFVLGSLWLSGSLAWLALAWSRVRPLRSLLRFAQPAPEWLAAEVREMAGRLGLRRIPGVWLVPGKLSPMLWSLGGPPRLLLPVELLESLTPDQRATLLIHELAHLHRRDHWVRWLELLATGLYWWHPVVWWARHELREAEEQCCDAWVVWALPGAGRTYATALLECLDFLSDVPAPLPAGASGMGHIADLKRRLTMIVQGTTPRCLTRGGLIALLGAGALMLPWLPSWAQDRDRRPEERKDERRADPKEIERAKAELEKLKDDLTARVKAVREAEDRLRQAAQKLHQLEGKGGEARDIRIIILRGDEAGGQGARIEFERFRGGERGGERGGDRGGQPRPMGGDDRRPMPGQPGTGGGGPGRGGEDRRVQDLERKFEEIMRELNELRRQMRGPGAGGPGAGGPGGDPRRPGAGGPGGQGGFERRPGGPGAGGPGGQGGFERRPGDPEGRPGEPRPDSRPRPMDREEERDERQP